MRDVSKHLYKDYEILLIKNDKLAEENSKLKYEQELLKLHLETLRKSEEIKNNQLEEKNKLIEAKDNEIARLKALLNIDGKNHGIPTSQTPINKKK